MTDRSKVDQVISGLPYPVADVNGRPPTGIADFTSPEVVAVTVDAGGRRVTFCGAARVDGDSVLVYEKDQAGTGKDVRTWQIAVRDGRFEATERAVF